ncbi:hypothetical protein VTO73DRAFT_232 [Trametes versicolor]
MLPLHGSDRDWLDPPPASSKGRWLSRFAAGSALFLSVHALLKLYSHATTVVTPPPYQAPSIPNEPAYPPTYSDYHRAELQLPQHHWDQTHPAGGEKFFFVAGHTKGLGWGNALQEHLLNAYLAYVSNRILVFENYTWADDGSLYSEWNGKLIPSQIPYSALVRGPTVGEPLASGVFAPLAVSREYFNHLCPHKTTLRRNQVHSRLPAPASAFDITERWMSVLKATEDHCVESASGDSDPIFTHTNVFGIRESLRDLWPSLAASPIITEFGWSRLVELAFDTNRGLLVPHASHMDPLLTSTHFTTNAERYTPIPGLMAIHVRRGDYAEHCNLLASMYEDFVSVNAFPYFPDTFTVPSRSAVSTSAVDNEEHYRQRCFPSVAEIVEKIARVRATPEGRDVRKLYIMTNGNQAFINELKTAVWALGAWDAVSSSRDMVLNWEQKYVAQAVDMLIAQRAQVFIGNGFSTLTSGAVMMRLANEFPADSTRFW